MSLPEKANKLKSSEMNQMNSQSKKHTAHGQKKITAIKMKYRTLHQNHMTQKESTVILFRKRTNFLFLKIETAVIFQQTTHDQDNTPFNGKSNYRLTMIQLP